MCVSCTQIQIKIALSPPPVPPPAVCWRKYHPTSSRWHGSHGIEIESHQLTLHASEHSQKLCKYILTRTSLLARPLRRRIDLTRNRFRCQRPVFLTTLRICIWKDHPVPKFNFSNRSKIGIVPTRSERMAKWTAHSLCTKSIQKTFLSWVSNACSTQSL